MQIVKEAEWLMEGSKLLVQQLIGGAALSRQVEKLRLHPHLVVGTPGRILELMKLKKLSLHHVKTIVVDEVDQVFDLGSQQEVEQVLKGSLRDRQVLFFSATVTPPIRKVADRWMNDPAEVRVKPEQRTAETLEHSYFVSEQRNKIDTLRKIIRSVKPRSPIEFINETDDIAEVEEKIRFSGLSIGSLYGEAGKQDRAKVMDGFRRGKFQLLLATDVAARGLDLPGVTHVIQFDPPMDADHYVHRAGRTGRMGRSGTVLSIVTERERFLIDKYAKALGIEIAEKILYGGEIIDAAAARGRQRSGGTVNEGGSRPGTARTSTPASPGNDGAKQRREAAAGANPVDHSRKASRPAGGPAGPSSRAAVTSTTGSSSKPAAAPARGRKDRDRERERKMKGAPKWLKEKRKDGGPS